MEEGGESEELGWGDVCADISYEHHCMAFVNWESAVGVKVVVLPTRETKFLLRFEVEYINSNRRSLQF